MTISDNILTSTEKKTIWKRALSKIGQVRQGSFEGSLSLSDSYWKERLDPLHRPTTELNSLWNEFKKDNTFQGRDFYLWLEVNKKLPKKQVNYLLNDESRKDYKFRFNKTDIMLSTIADKAISKTGEQEIIFVLSKNNEFYFGVKSVGTFHHSSMLAGAPVIGAGTIRLHSRSIIEINNHSGHYRPEKQAMKKVVIAMKLNGAAIDKITLRLYESKRGTLEWEGKAAELIGLP